MGMLDNSRLGESTRVLAETAVDMAGLVLT